MNYKDLLLEKKDGIATITLNTPDKMNALTMKMSKSLGLAVDEVTKDDEVRVVIITGAGRAFCAGGDIELFKARFIDGSAEVSRYEYLRMLGHDWLEVLPKLDKPVIAAINGACIGAGFSLALNCDIRIASEKAKFGSAFVSFGLAPDSGMTYLLPRLVGISKALELMFSGEQIDATEAQRLGIVSRVVPHDELIKVSQELAVRIAQQPSVAVELTKRLVYRSMFGDVTRYLDWEAYAAQLCFQTDDFKQSVLAFLEKRARPPFKGK